MIHARRPRALLTPSSTGYTDNENKLSRVLHAENADNVQT